MRCKVRHKYEDHLATLIKIKDGQAWYKRDDQKFILWTPVINIVEAGPQVDGEEW